MNRRLLLSLVAAGNLVSALPAQAGLNVWTTNGPESPVITAIAIDPQMTSTLYIGTRGGWVFRSSDAGAHWKKLWYAGAAGGSISCLLVDPRDSRTLYAGTGEAGIWKSQDGGGTWNSRNEGLTYLRILACRPIMDKPDAIYVSSSGGVHKTEDGGAHWETLLSSTSLISLEIDSANSQNLYAGSFGISSSHDGGKTWSFSFGVKMPVKQIAVNPRNGSVVYAIGSDGASSYLYKSDDAGATWNFVPIAEVSSMVFDSGSPPHLYLIAGGMILRDEPAAFTGFTSVATIDRSDFLGRPLVADPKSPSTFYAGGAGLLKSADAGTTWSQITSGLADSLMTAVAIDPNTPATLYAGSPAEAMLFRSRNGGLSWEIAGNPRTGVKELGVTTTGVNSIAVDPYNSSSIVVANAYLGKSSDGGATWEVASIKAESGSFFFLANSPSFQTIVFDPLSPGTVYAGGSYAVLRTTDAGDNWTFRGLGGFPSSFGGSVAIAATNPSSVYVATSNGLYRLTESTTAWVRLELPASAGLTLPNLTAIAIDPQAPATIYVGTSEAGGFFDEDPRARSNKGSIFKSVDGGYNWTETELVDHRINSVVVRPSTPSDIFAATDIGIFRSSDAGQTWQAMNDGLDNPYVYQLAIDPTGQFLHAATATGVYDYTICPTRTRRGAPACPRAPIRVSPR